jgi:polysaccharide transporter, PST family
VKLIKTSLYTSVSTAITFISGFIVTKVVAVKIGPQGIAYVGQFQNTVTIFTLVSTGLIGAGVVKYIAEFYDDSPKQQRVINTAYKIVLLSSIITSIIVLLSSSWLSQQAFHSKEFTDVYLLYGFFIILMGLNTFFSSMLNGLKLIPRLTAVNIIGSLSGIIYTVFFAYQWGVKGVLIAGNFTALTVFIINIIFLRKFNLINWKPDLRHWDKEILRLFSGFILMSLMSFLLPFTQLIVRDTIIKDFSVEEAGYWQAVTKISDYYLMFITTVIGVYYMPRLSEIREKAELRKEILSAYKIIMPVVTVMALLIWLFRSLIVRILFAPDFLPMLPLFKYQLIGDVLKIASWLIAYLMIAKAQTKLFITTELIFTATYILFSLLFIQWYGVIGATYAFCFNYLIYSITIFFILRRNII